MYIYIYIYTSLSITYNMYICIYIYIYVAVSGASWLRTNGVNTNGAAAKVMNFDRLGKKVHPGTLEKIKVG